MIFLGTCVTEDYLPKARDGFIPSLGLVTEVYPFVITVGCHAEEKGWGRTNYLFMPQDQVRYNSPNYTCLQDGQFLPYLPGLLTTDTIILCDADTVIQRDLTTIERQRFSSYDNMTVGAGWNRGPHDTLAVENKTISPLVTEGDLAATMGNLNKPLYNCGFLVMRAELWARVGDLYDKAWDATKGFWANPRCNQWRMNWCFHELGLLIDVLGYELHSHGHFHPRGADDNEWRKGALYHRDEKVFLRHKLNPS